MTRRLAAVAAAVAGSGLAAVGLAGPASATVLANQPVGVDHCEPNTSQDCPQAPEVSFTVPAADNAKVSFTASPGHCSDINVRFAEGGNSLGGFQRVAPGQTVSSQIAVGPGAHTIKVFAQGIQGGCNTGSLDGWGGTVRVESAPGVVGVNEPAPQQPQPAGQGAPPPVEGPPQAPAGDQQATQGPFDPDGSDELHVH